jgi:ubiquinol-cytochrome c reductase cytochrome c subunit
MTPAHAREANTLSRILRVGLVLAVGAQIAWSFRPLAGGAATEQETLGRQLFDASCTTCHGVDGLGTANGPSLKGVGSAAVEFFLSTGRMPLADPGDQPVRQAPAFTAEEIAAIVAYLRPITAGGPEIPTVAGGGSLSLGQQLYLNNCTGCHGAGGEGDSVGGGEIAPSLADATDVQIAEAVRVGPGVMPKFGERSITPSDVDALVAYLMWIREHGNDGGASLGRAGAVAEGFVAMVIGLGALIVVIRLTGSKL